MPLFAFHGEGASHQVHQFPGNSQPQSRSTEFAGHGSVGLGKPFKNEWQFIGRNADTGVAD